MFGYVEPKYDVRATFTGKSLVYELRETAPISCVRPGMANIPYIAITGKDVDFLLKYLNPEDIKADWEVVTNMDIDSDIDLDKLNWSERIEHHHIGFGRDGSVAMY